MDAIILGVYLNRDGSTVAFNLFQNAGYASLYGNAASTCVNGTYTGSADATLDAPAGFTPESQELGPVVSPPIAITC